MALRLFLHPSPCSSLFALFFALFRAILGAKIDRNPFAFSRLAKKRDRSQNRS
jgi:hypothetical protein